MRKTKKSVKYMQVLERRIYRELSVVARKRGITIQELARAVIFPEWLYQIPGLKIRMLALQMETSRLRSRLRARRKKRK